MAADEAIHGGGRFGTDRGGYADAALREAVAGPGLGDRGLRRHQQAHRQPAARRPRGSRRLPPTLSARARVFATGQGRKTDATDAHSVALVGTRMSGLRPVVNDEQLAILRILFERRRSLGEHHTRTIYQLHQLLPELIPGGTKTNLSAAQAKALLAKVRRRDAAGKTRRRVAAELIGDLERIYERKKAADKELIERDRSLRGVHPVGRCPHGRLRDRRQDSDTPRAGAAYHQHPRGPVAVAPCGARRSRSRPAATAAGRRPAPRRGAPGSPIGDMVTTGAVAVGSPRRCRTLPTTPVLSPRPRPRR